MLLPGLKGIGRIMADPGYDATLSRAVIADHLGATADIRAPPSRTASLPSIVAATKSTIRSNDSSTRPDASVTSLCAERKPSPPSWTSSIPHAP